ncbi:MAG: hypothetical protein RR271_05475 [Oscillospiraceae bacterium]
MTEPQTAVDAVASRPRHLALPFRLTRAELAKVWRSRVFLLLLTGLLCINLFLLWVVTNPLQGAYSSHAYRTMNVNLQGLSMREKSDFINEEFRKTQGLAVIDGVVRMEAYNQGKPDTYARERYAAEFAEFYEIYKAKSYLTYNDTLAKEYKFLQKMQAECETVYGYEGFLDSVAQKATQLSGISIFAESADGYDMKNITATAAAYEGMRGVPIDYTPQMGLFTALDFSLTDVIAVFAMLLIATVLVRSERDSGLLNIIRATPAGRLKTAGAKLFSLTISLAGVLVLLYGVNLLYCGGVYGLGSLSRSIQSVPALMRSTLLLNVGQYIGLFLFTKWLAAVVAGVWVMLCMLVAKRAFGGTLGALSLLGLNLFIRTIIPATSRFNVLKYANLVSLLRTNELIGGYRNLYWFSSPVSIVLVEGAMAAGCFVLFTALFCRAFAHWQLRSSGRLALPRALSFLLQLRKKRPIVTTVQRTEWRKLLLMNGALLFVLLFAGYQVYTALNTQSYIDADEIYYSHYIKQVQGPVTQEKIDLLKTQWEEFRPLAELDAQLRAGEITSEQYQMMMGAYANLQQKYNAYNRVLSKFEYFKTHPRAQFVYESSYLKLFDTADRNDVTDTLLASLLCVLCFAGFFAMERQSGVARVIAATPLGRSATVKAKLRCANWLCGALALLSVLPRVWIVLRDYGLGAFFAPSYSMAEFDGTPEIPLFFLLLLFPLARFVALRLVAGVTLVLSQKLGNLFSALFAGGIIFSLPLLLSLSGLSNAKWLSVYPLFHTAALFANTAEMVAALFVLGICGAGIYCGNWYLQEHFGQTEART